MGVRRLDYCVEDRPVILHWDASLLFACGVLELSLLNALRKPRASWTAIGCSLLLDENRRRTGFAQFSAHSESTANHEVRSLTQLRQASAELEIGETVTEVSARRPIALIPLDDCRLQLASTYAFTTSRGCCDQASCQLLVECSEVHGLETLAEVPLEIAGAAQPSGLSVTLAIGDG